MEVSLKEFTKKSQITKAMKLIMTTWKLIVNKCFSNTKIWMTIINQMNLKTYNSLNLMNMFKITVKTIVKTIVKTTVKTIVNSISKTCKNRSPKTKKLLKTFKDNKKIQKTSTSLTNNTKLKIRKTLMPQTKNVIGRRR